MEQLSSTIDTRKSIYEGCDFFYGLPYLWEISWRIHGRSECALGHLENVHVHHSSSINFYRQRIERYFLRIKEDIHQKSDHWLRYIIRNYLSKTNGIRRLYMEIDKLIVRKSWTDNYWQSLCLPRFNTLTGWGNPSAVNEAWRKKIVFCQTEFVNSKMMKNIQYEPEEFGERLIFMWMFHEIEWR